MVDADLNKLLKDPSFLLAMDYVILGYFFGWTPDVIDSLPYPFVARCKLLVSAFAKELGASISGRGLGKKGVML